MDDITCELETKYGTLSSIVIPQPSQKGPASDPSGVGLVFVQFAKLSDAVSTYSLQYYMASLTVFPPCSNALPCFLG